MTADEVKEARAEVFRLMGSLHPSSDTPVDVRWFHQGLLGGLASRLVDDLERYVGRTETFNRDIGQEPIYRVDRYPATDRRPKPTADLVELLDLLGLSWKLEKDPRRTPLELFHDCIVAVRELVDVRAVLLEERRQLRRQLDDLRTEAKLTETNIVEQVRVARMQERRNLAKGVCDERQLNTPYRCNAPKGHDGPHEHTDELGTVVWAPVQGCAICTDDPSSNIGCERHPVPR